MIACEIESTLFDATFIVTRECDDLNFTSGKKCRNKEKNTNEHLLTVVLFNFSAEISSSKLQFHFHDL